MRAYDARTRTVENISVLIVLLKAVVTDVGVYALVAEIIRIALNVTRNFAVLERMTCIIALVVLSNFAKIVAAVLSTVRNAKPRKGTTSRCAKHAQKTVGAVT